MTIKVLVVDDSAVVRQVLSKIVESDRALELMAAVADPLFALKRMEKSWPDVIILDVEMPRMDGITFLRKIMDEHPTPVVMCSTLTHKGAETTMEALAAGAVDIIAKPRVGGKEALRGEASELLDAVKGAAKAKFNIKRMRPQVEQAERKVGSKLSADVMMNFTPQRAMKETTERFVAMGTSTGGTQALEQILKQLPRVCCGIVIVQHMPEKFTAAFAQRLNGLCEIEVKEAADGDRIRPGYAFIAPGGKHLMVRRSGAQYICQVKDGPLVCRHRPSVDVLFRSVAKAAGVNAMGIIMTGMGDDGANGLLEMHQTGAYTIAQDEKTSVVYGMPKEAVKKGAVDQSLPLEQLPIAIIKNERQLSRKARSAG